MNTLECPRRDTLKEYLSGKLNEEDSAVLETHLAVCKTCEDTAGQIDYEPDTYAEILQLGQELDESLGGADAYSLGPARELIDFRSANLRSASQITGSVGSYDLVRQLGRGGMGSVYLARHRELQKDVAIKLLPKLTADREDVINRFRKEMRAVGRLDHPSIVKATDAGESGGVHFLVMEVADGLDVSRVARLVDSLSIEDACEIIRQTALGLAYAHERGVIHRDIKPSNLMLSPDGKVKILDFGLAQLTYWEEPAAELTTVGQMMGTLDYMAPEQGSRSSDVSTRCDIYSLGATLFKLLAGKPPLATNNRLSPLEKLRLLSEHQVLSIRDHRTDVPQGLASLLHRMLATDPADRPASAKAVAEEIELFCERACLQTLLKTAVKQSRQQDVEGTPSLPFVAPENVSPNALPPAKGWLLGLSTSGFLAVLIAGILITLELTKGQLVIQSDDADLTVQISSLDSENYSQELQIEPGANATRLRSGNYEITLSKGSDRFALTKNTFTIRRGDVEVARVTTINNDAVRPTTGAGLNTVMGGASALAADPFGNTNGVRDPFDPNFPINSLAGKSQRTDQTSKQKVDQGNRAISSGDIYLALRREIEVNYHSMPLQQVVSSISDELRIPAWINTQCLEEMGVSSDEPITLNLPPVSARSVLALILDPLKLGYLVRNEVLEITSAADAKANSPLAMPGDTLAIYLEGVIPMVIKPSSPLPIPVLQAGHRSPVQGLPFTLDESGNITLPLLGELNVEGMTLEQIRESVKREYINAKILKEDELRKVSVTVAFLMRKGEELPVKNLTNANSQ